MHFVRPVDALRTFLFILQDFDSKEDDIISSSKENLDVFKLR